MQRHVTHKLNTPQATLIKVNQLGLLANAQKLIRAAAKFRAVSLRCVEIR